MPGSSSLISRIEAAWKINVEHRRFREAFGGDRTTRPRLADAARQCRGPLLASLELKQLGRLMSNTDVFAKRELKQLGKSMSNTDVFAKRLAVIGQRGLGLPMPRGNAGVLFSH